MTLSEIVIRYRKEHALSQRQFAKICGLSNGYISMLERNLNPNTGLPLTPSLPALKRIAAGMGVSLHSLMLQASDMPVDINSSDISREEIPAPALKDKIKQLRKQHGLTLEEVGNAVGVGKSTVRKWETGDIANMRRDKIASLAEALHTTPGYLMGWEDSPTGAAQTPAPGTRGGRAAEFAALFSRLTPEQQALVIAQIKGILAQTE